MKNQTGRYLKYAIGEIILVVIGILIALQINNWNEKQIAKGKSIEYHKRLIEELELKASTFVWDTIRSREMTKYLMASVSILEQSKTNLASMDSLDYTLRNYFQFVRLDANLNTYDEMKSSGDLGLIYNIELRKSIISYLTYIDAISKVYDQLSSQVNTHEFLDPYIRQVVKLDTVTTIRLEQSQLYNNSLVINRLSRFADHWKTKYSFSKTLLDQTNKLKDEIENELKK